MLTGLRTLFEHALCKMVGAAQADRPGIEARGSHLPSPCYCHLESSSVGAMQAWRHRSACVLVSPIGARDADEIERGVARFRALPNGGLIVRERIWRSFIAI